MEILYTPRFIKRFKKLPPGIKTLIVSKETIFKINPLTPSLKTHKLNGKLSQFYSFSVNYQYRVLFFFEKNSATFLDVGTHSIKI